MTDISRAERRLIAALDRLDHAVERGARRIAQSAAETSAAPIAAPDTAETAPPVAEAPVSAEIAALHDRQAATLEAMQVRLAEAHDRLASAGEQAARLAGANDELARANRLLIDAASGDWTADGPDATRAALEAEVEALRAARAAEIAQMAEILDALDRMLGVTTTPRSHSTEGRREARPGRTATAGGKDEGQRAGNAAGDDEGEPAAAVTATPAVSSTDSAADPAPRELTVIRDEDPLPEDILPDEDSPGGEALPGRTRDTLPEDDLADEPPQESPRSPDTRPGASALFGGVYDDDPGALDADDEERS